MDVLSPRYDGSLNTTYTGTAGTVGPFPPCNAVWVWASTDAFIKIGEGVTATNNDFPMPAFTPVLFRVDTMNAFSVSAIQITSGGSVYANPVNGAQA